MPPPEEQIEAYVEKPVFSFKNINLYLERDNALRAHEVLVVSLDKEGNDKEWFNFYVTDQGSIRQINMSQLVPRTEEKDG